MIDIISILQTYLRFIRGHAHVHLLSPVHTSLRRSTSFVLPFPAQPFRLVASRILPPLFSAVYSTVGICPLVGIFVLQGELSKKLAFRENIEDSAPFLRAALQLFVSNVFGGGSKVFRKLDDSFRASWLACFVQYYWRSPLLSPG